jgi:hypothetical protein
MIYDKITPEVETIIIRMCARWGNAAEHTLHCYENNITNVAANATPIILHCEDDDMGILASYEPDTKECRVFTEILAPLTDKVGILQLFLDTLYALRPYTKKVWVETVTSTRKHILEYIEGYKIHNINYTLIWPVFDMHTWTGAAMQGGEWKDIRYYWNKFHKEHTVQFNNEAINEKECLELLYKWKRERKVRDKADIGYYENAIRTGFKGYDIIRIMRVDGKIATMTAGFQVRKDYYYSSIGIYDPTIPRCNEIANMDDLINLQKLGYTTIDFGGVEKEHLDFKKKFKPTKYYKTHIYSIERKKC